MQDQPLATLRPKISVGLLSTAVQWIFLGTIVAFYISDILIRDGSWTTGIVVFLAVWGFVLISKYLNLKQRKYTFYKGRAEFYEGFFNINQKSVPYQRVTDIDLRRSII